MSKLAILGGKKTINQKMPHFKWPPISKKIEKAVIKQLYKSISIYDKSGIIKEFEDNFSKYHHRKYGLLCSSGTLAIHSMFVAADLKKGDEVICPAYTFFATVTPLLFTDAKPILCDCDENGNIDPQEIKKKITKKTRAVVITHMWGIPCQMDEIVEICKKHNLLLLEDCSHSHGALYKQQLTGTFGDIASWSLQGQKTVTGGEGGILLTNNKDFYNRALLLGHYNKRCKQEIEKSNHLNIYSVTGMGLKYRSHPLAIVIASEMFKQLNSFLRVRKIFAKRLINSIKTAGLVPPKGLSYLHSSWYGLIFQYKPDQMNGLSIERFVDALHAEGLLEVDRPNSTSPLNLLPLFQTPGDLFPVYKNPKYNFSYRPGDFPKAEIFYKNAIKIPVWSFMKDEKMLNLYIKGFKKVIKNYKSLL